MAPLFTRSLLARGSASGPSQTLNIYVLLICSNGVVHSVKKWGSDL